MEFKVTRSIKTTQALFPGNVLRHRTSGSVYLVGRHHHNGNFRYVRLDDKSNFIYEELAEVSEVGEANLVEWQVFRVAAPILLEVI